jgi:tryptophan halogenase
MADSSGAFSIVIVGGGTAGWLSAAFLHEQLPQTLNRPVRVRLVEASDIPIIGVGEATIPSLRNTLAAARIDEAQFLCACDATFKLGIEFVNWRKAPAEDPGEGYFHPFGPPITVNGQNPAWQWSRLPVAERGAFADLFSVQHEMALAGRAPKTLRDAAFDGALAYAYHLDAGKFAEFLKHTFRERGVEQTIAKVAQVTMRDDGDVDHLLLQDGTRVDADFFIDCTGFAARLINADDRNAFVSKGTALFADRAVATRIPHNGLDAIAPYTRSTAQEAGWIWDIALQSRRGVGYVYSSRHTDDDAALAALARYLGAPPESLDARKLDMRIGFQAEQWRGNCVAIGLSSGFLEPLESTGIYLIEMANWALADMLPRHVAGAAVQARYNEIMTNHYENIADFLKLHYCLSQRRDTQFWIDNANADTIPATLQKKLEMWRDAIPSVYDFDRATQCFSANNYQYILFGMDWPGHRRPVSGRDMQIERMLGDLKVRRERLRQRVLRDTVPAADVFRALSAEAKAAPLREQVQ